VVNAMSQQPKITPINLDRTFTAEEVNEVIDTLEAGARQIFYNMAWASGFAFGAGIGLGYLLGMSQ
jgi:hypothetical protein